MGSVSQLAQARIASYREPPYGACKFAVEQLGFHPDPWQEKTLVAFCDPRQRRISLQACAGPGKSAATAVCGWYFLSTQCTPGEHPKGLATSITGENLRDNLWTEMAKWQGRSAFLQEAFTWSAKRIFANDHPETWFLAARSWPKSGSADEQGRTFSGLHGRNVAVFVDESGAIPPTVLRAAEQALPNTLFGKIMQSGNPISLEGMLHEAANRLRDQWTIIIVNGDPDDPESWVNSPRVRAQQNPDEEDMTAAAMNRKQIETYGRDNPWVMSYILGQFPKSTLNSLLTIDEVTDAMKRELKPHQYEYAQKRLGVDVARFGDDRSVIFPRQGMASWFQPEIMRVADTTQIAARVAMAFANWGAELALIDDTGHWGHGVLDNLRAAGMNAIGVNFAAKAINNRYYNRRVEMWLEMAKAVRGGAALPDIPELVPELTTPTYTFVNGVFRLEEKDQVKLRLGRSPDIADAYALTYSLADAPSREVAREAGLRTGTETRVGGGVATTNYDPFQEAA